MAIKTIQKPERTRARSIILPTILIVVGVLFLLSNFGWLPRDTPETLWRLWPLIPISMGIEILVARIRGQRVAGSVAAFAGFCLVVFFIWLFASIVSMGVLTAGLWQWPFNAVRGSGQVVTQTLDFSDFSQIEIAGPFHLEVSQSETFGAAITADDNLFDHIVASKDGDKLRIALKPVTFIGTPTLQAKVTTPILSRLVLSGASKGTINGFKSNTDLALEISGASRLEGQVEAGNARINVSGASKMNLNGTANMVDLTASGAANIELSEFEIADAKVKVEGASRATINASGVLDVEASGASHVYHVGTAPIGNSRVSGASKVERR